MPNQGKAQEQKTMGECHENNKYLQDLILVLSVKIKSYPILYSPRWIGTIDFIL